MVNWFYDCYSILNKVYSDKAFFKQALSDTVIEEKNRPLTVKTCYGVLERDGELSYYIKQIADKSPKLVIRTILKISMYAIKYLDKHGYAVTKNAVELTKKLGKAGMSGFVNAFLRKFIDYKFTLPKDEELRLSIKTSYPLFAVKQMVEKYGISRAEKILSAPHADICLSFYDTDGKAYLESQNSEFESTPFENVYTLKKFTRTPEYDDGVYTYQALGSVAICEAVTPCESLLDCCSAPGGKAIRLSHKCGSVTSWDIHEHRVELIESYKTRMHVTNVKASVKDAKVYDEEFKESFDAVLCDAPCSGLGVAGDNPDIKINRTEESVKELIEEQLQILTTVSKYLKKGGCLYYSTCSILPCENDGTIERFLELNKDFAVERVTSPLNGESTLYGVQFLPDISGGNGFYLSKLKKVR
ncbi:MAG: methyltransferase domain-containing protein [Clostridiales bacterium]|nr:methyltransferase domain-containing protein [Clostridiales bacterium]